MHCPISDVAKQSMGLLPGLLQTLSVLLCASFASALVQPTRLPICSVCPTRAPFHRYRFVGKAATAGADDEDNEDDDPFADLIKVRDVRREIIKQKAATLLDMFEDEDEESGDDGSAEKQDVKEEEEEEEEDAMQEEHYTADEDFEILEENDIDDDENYRDDDAAIGTRELFDRLFELADADESGGIDVDGKSTLSAAQLFKPRRCDRMI